MKKENNYNDIQGLVIEIIKKSGLDINDIVSEIQKEEGKKDQKEKNKDKKKPLDKRRNIFSEDNVREMQRMILAGSTTKQILEYFGIKSPTTIHNWIFRHNKYEGNRKRYMEKIHQNNIDYKKKTEVDIAESSVVSDYSTDVDADPDAISDYSTDVDADPDAVSDNSADVDADPDAVSDNSADVDIDPDAVSDNSADVDAVITHNYADYLDYADYADYTDYTVNESKTGAKYLLDNNIIIRRECREYWPSLVAKLKKEKAIVYLDSRRRLKTIKRRHKSPEVKKIINEILLDNFFIVIESPLNEQSLARELRAKVIAGSEITQKYCKDAGVKIIMLQDYIAIQEKESFEIDLNDEEAIKWARRFTIPVVVNNNHRIIASIKDLVKFVENQYGESVERIEIFDAKNKERTTPTGRIRLVKDDTIKITTYQKVIILKIIEETLKNNCIEISYKYKV